MAMKSAAGEIRSEAREVIEKNICNAVSASGEYETVEIKYTREYGRLNVTVLIWSPQGITLEDCERVHNAVSGALDCCEELFPSEYVLNISSQGLDRPIVTDDDFRRAIGTEIEARIPEGTVHGTLTAFDDDSFTLNVDKNKQKIISRKIKAEVSPYIRF